MSSATKPLQIHTRPIGPRMALAAAALCLMLNRSIQAVQVVIDDPLHPAFLSSLLISHNFAIVGNNQLRFDNFTYTPTPNPLAPATIPDAATIRVMAVESPGNPLGLLFQATNQFMAMNTESGDGILKFDVTDLNPTQTLIKAHMDFTGGTNGTGLSEVSEVGRDPTGLIQVYQKSVIQSQSFQPSGGESSFTVPITPPQSMIHVSKDIFVGSVLSGDVPNFASISDFTQTFTQDPAVPEPSSFVLVVLGGGGLGWFGWRRKRRHTARVASARLGLA
jgi:PEP-CTERM motif-containing protein